MSGRFYCKYHEEDCDSVEQEGCAVYDDERELADGPNGFKDCRDCEFYSSVLKAERE